ncbi:hypothetical protein EAG_09711 [Camponotus floridanus]|uniref:CCHC-type domain-containing protein n=1 Tax=Camponotus floridanus TaxID=104421 RepID=E2AUZ3_CAMFO|nr:hypothetical protein EAG_09711 [Camponotus floridanus]
MTARKALTGAQIYEIKGPDNAKKADALAARLREVLAEREGVRVTRPVMMAEIRVRDLDDSATPSQVTDAIVQATGCDPDNIKVGVIRSVGRGMGTLWVRCPMAAANKLTAAKKLRVGWVNARIEALEPRQLQCFKCLEKGHVQAQCSSGVNRAACCYRCGKEGHIARDCQSPVKCPICAGLKRPDGHKAGSRACTAPKKRAKGKVVQPAPRAERVAPGTSQQTGTTGATTQHGSGGDRDKSRVTQPQAEEDPQEVEMKETEESAPPLPQRERRKRDPSCLCCVMEGTSSCMETEQEEPNTREPVWV